MPPLHPHLFADISAHGYGHLAQAAPVLNRLAELLPGLRLTLRSALPAKILRQRIHARFTHLPAASDCGYAMIDALTIDLAATAKAYRAAHADFPARVAAEARWLRQLKPNAVFSDVAYLPLAGAAQAGIPAVALCSLNWADLFEHFFGGEPWAGPIHVEMLTAYRTATFLRTTPAMPMPLLTRQIEIGAIATLGRERRKALQAKVGAGDTARFVLVGLGGIPARLPIEDWPMLADTFWLLPRAWLGDRRPARADFHAIESFGWPFPDLLRSVDAVVTKPGYGTFAEAVRNGTAVIFQRRDDWPEQDCLIDWLRTYGRAAEISAAQLAAGDLGAALDVCLQLAVPPAPTFDGTERAAQYLAALLT